MIFSQKPKVASTGHFGSRIVFDGQGNIFISLGERQQERFRGQAQDLGSDLGKVVRIRPGGSVSGRKPLRLQRWCAAGDLDLWASQCWLRR